MRRYLHFRSAAVLGWLFALPVAVMSATVEVVESSDPAGLVSRSSLRETPSNYWTTNAPMEISGYRFTHWSVNGVRYGDATGCAMNPVFFVVYEPVEAVACYIPEDQDNDADGVPDWFELRFFGDLTRSADSDEDGDGFALKEEWRLDLSPLVFNTAVSGGISFKNNSGGSVFVPLQGYFSYTEKSEPPGFVSRFCGVYENSNVTSSAVITETNGYTFACWEVNGVRMAGAQEMSLARFTLAITTNTVAVAKYLPSDLDTVGDGIPDWWRIRYFGDLGEAAGADPDGDGLTLAQEYRGDTHPLVFNSFVSGGVSMRNSQELLFNQSDYHRWSISSLPSGLILNQSGVALAGKVIKTDKLGSILSGYQFGFWSLNGVRQADSNGVALSQLCFALSGDAESVAHFFPADEDLDGNGLPDWWELRYLGAAGQDPSAPAPGGGLSLAAAYRCDYSPVVSNAFISGGVSMRNSEVVGVNLQPFERVRYILCNGVLTDWFTVSPTGVLGIASFGGPSAPAVGDWDGDGDSDLFVTATNGSLQAFENSGSRYTPDLAGRTETSLALGGLLSGMNDVHLAFGDWTRDGRDDVVAGGANGRLRLIPSAGSFAAQPTPASVYDVDLGAEEGRILPTLTDVTGDGLPDLLVLGASGLVGVLSHRGDTACPYALPLWTNDLLAAEVPHATGLTTADVDRNGTRDLLVSDAEGRIWEFVRQPNGQFRLMSKVWGGLSAGYAKALSVAAADLDGDGDEDALAGFQQGGLLFLRDPRLGKPGNVKALGGADSVALSWDPDRQTRIKGYAVYRSGSAQGPFSKCHEGLLADTRFVDLDVSTGGTYFYTVTAATLAYFPGSTVGTMRESPPSEAVSAQVGTVRLWMPDFSGDRGQTAVLKINVDRAQGIAGQGLSLGVRYNPSYLTPVSQIYAETQTVRRTAMSESLAFTDNAGTASGELLINGQSGSLVGEGTLFDVVFYVQPGTPQNAQSTNAFLTVAFYGAGGQALAVDASDACVFVATAAYQEGDATGDGVLDQNDVDLLLYLLKKGSRSPTPAELNACDLDGDGLLTHRDIPLLMRLIHGKNINP